MALRGQTPLSRVIEAAEEAAIVIEMVGGVGSWEIMPGMKHSRITKAIDRSISRNAIAESDCGCYS